MKRILVDTNGWIALNSKRDQLHNTAININKELLKNGYRYVTTRKNRSFSVEEFKRRRKDLVIGIEVWVIYLFNSFKISVSKSIPNFIFCTLILSSLLCAKEYSS